MALTTWKAGMIENFTPPGFTGRHALCSDPKKTDLIFSFLDNNLLLLKEGQLPEWQNLKTLVDKEKFELYCFGEINQQRCLLLSPPEEDLFTHPNFKAQPVRFCHEILAEPHSRLAGLARQLEHWRSTHIFCGHCGSKTLDQQEERAKICPDCRFISYPELSPCIIVLVTRRSDLLLARSPHFRPGIYSTLAGFIEPGESVENAVYREIKEEVGLSVKNIRYILSQPWPFPNSLMLGFLAEYESGEIVIDPIEIEDAQWFKPSELPKLPSPLSISRLLIEKHLSSS
jgi:NAD+ diphosphatase